MNKKPPLGLMPKKLHDSSRMLEIMNAVIRYFRDCKSVPIEWIEEYNELTGEGK